MTAVYEIDQPITIEDERRRSFEQYEMSDLRVDHTYQREFRETRIKQIIKNFSPLLMLPLTINIRDDGTPYVVDGQHRMHVLMKLFGRHHRADCLTYWGLSYVQEAWLFDQLNKAASRSVLTPQESLKGGLVSGDPKAEQLRRVVESCGYQIDPSTTSHANGNIVGIAALNSAIGSWGPLSLAAGLNLYGDTWGREDGPPFYMVREVPRFAHMYAGKYDHDRFVKRFRMTTPEVLKDKANVLAIQGGLDRVVAWNLKMTEQYNHGLGESARLPTILEMRASGDLRPGRR
jgi:hypothetical protein